MTASLAALSSLCAAVAVVQPRVPRNFAATRVQTTAAVAVVQPHIARNCAPRTAPITACADLPPPAALTLDRTYSSTLRTEGLKILEQIEPQSLAALKSERTRLLAPSERGLAVAAAAALLALTRSRRPVGVALGLFAAVRALSALLGRAPSAGDPRFLVPPRQLGAAVRQAPLLVAEVAQLGGLALLLGACALSAAVERALRVVDRAVPLALAADDAAGEGRGPRMSAVLAPPAPEEVAAEEEEEVVIPDSLLNLASVEPPPPAPAPPAPPPVDAELGKLSLRAARLAAVHALLCAAAAVWAAEVGFLVALALVQRARLLVIQAATATFISGQRFRPAASGFVASLPRSRSEFGQAVSYRLAIVGLQMEQLMTDGWARHLRWRSKSMRGQRGGGGRASGDGGGGGVKLWWDRRVAGVRQGWAGWQLKTLSAGGADGGVAPPPKKRAAAKRAEETAKAKKADARTRLRRPASPAAGDAAADDAAAGGWRPWRRRPRAAAEAVEVEVEVEVDTPKPRRWFSRWEYTYPDAGSD